MKIEDIQIGKWYWCRFEKRIDSRKVIAKLQDGSVLLWSWKYCTISKSPEIVIHEAKPWWRFW